MLKFIVIFLLCVTWLICVYPFTFLISENEIFGEMGVIDDELRMADARCMEESELVSITREEFNKILSESNVFVRGVLGVLSARLRAAQKRR